MLELKKGAFSDRTAQSALGQSTPFFRQHSNGLAMGVKPKRKAHATILRSLCSKLSDLDTAPKNSTCGCACYHQRKAERSLMKLVTRAGAAQQLHIESRPHQTMAHKVRLWYATCDTGGTPLQVSTSSFEAVQLELQGCMVDFAPEVQCTGRCTTN